MASEDTIFILVEFTGGLEMLFADERKHKISIPAKDNKGNPVTVGWLVNYLCENLMKDSRKELFVLDDHVFRIPSPYGCIRHRCNQASARHGWQSILTTPSELPFPVYLVEPHTRVLVSKAHTVLLHRSRPGILVLINDADWELEGEASYALQPNDNILFVSTLHGG